MLVLPPKTEPQRALSTAFSLPFRILLACLWVLPTFGQEVKVYVTSQAGDRLTPKPPVRFENQKKASAPLFRILTGNMLQRMVGFGASFQEAGMICLNDLPRAKQEAVLRSLFDPDQGAGFSAMKTPIAATGFMSAGPWYSYDETPGDVGMKNFTIQRDLGPNGVITYIKRARQYGQFVLQASMDYPPEWMLVDVEKNQDVNPKYYDALARYYLRYVQEYEKNGVLIDYLSPFNEPDTYTKVPYEKIREIVKRHVGPLFAKAGVKTKIMLSEAPNREDAYRHYPIVLDDPEARRYISAMPYHGYGFKDFNLMADLHRRYAELPMWMTGVDHRHGTDAPRSVPLPRYDYEDGDFWGNQIFNDLETGAVAWIYGNMILDEQGGPCQVSEVHEDPPGNLQHPVVIINRHTKQVTYTALYYYLAHFGKFVRPGAMWVLMEGRYSGLRAVAFLSPEPDGGWYWVVELLNGRQTDAPVQVDFELDWVRRSLQLTLPAMSISTCIWKPLPHTLGNMPAQ